MKRKFKVTIDGETYEVDVEEVAGTKAPDPTSNVPPAPGAKPPPAVPKVTPAAPPPVTKPPLPIMLGEGMIPSPMQGLVFAVKVKVGDTVKTGDVLIILEAMKMESDIHSPKDGKVKEIHVSQGGYVKKGEPLITIEG